jgi:hypothetical protein
MGFDALPGHIKHSDKLTGNHLGQLANCTAIPELRNDFVLTETSDLQSLAVSYLDKGDVDSAWQVLLRTQ